MEETERKYYFAYGSNINLKQMDYRCPDAVPVTPVVLNGYDLTYRGGGVATIVPQNGAVVHGLLWKITPECEVALDHYEGYPNFYRKDSVVVRDPKTNTGYRVMAYVMTEGYIEPAIPSDFYFKSILDGYRQNNMNTRPLIQSLQKVKSEVEELYHKDPWFEFGKNWRLAAPRQPRPFVRGNKPKDRGR